MSKLIDKLSQGQHVFGKVERIMDNDRLLVNIDGNYLFVQNQSDQVFKFGQSIELLVDNLNPLRLKIVRAKPSVGNFEINV